MNHCVGAFPVVILLGCLWAPGCQSAAAPAEGAEADLSRRYREGERFSYAMTAVNQDRVKTLRYTATASVVVQRGEHGFAEEVDWSDLVVNDRAVALPKGAAVHQQLSLAPDSHCPMPDLAHLHPQLMGPVLDLMTFYVDLWLAIKDGRLKRAGDHMLFPHGTANSWADGSYVTLGEDAIDFDITLTAVDRMAGVATLLVRHVPPANPVIRLPADWMRQPVADTANNWVQVQRSSDGKAFDAAVGKETFDVELQVSLADGRILRATMDNIVDVLERRCRDGALDDPGQPVRYRIHRQIAIERHDAVAR
jgi:hypothetical protein